MRVFCVLHPYFFFLPLPWIYLYLYTSPVLTDLGFASEVDLAFSIYDDMRMAGIPPSVNTYNRLLGVCEKVTQNK